MADLGAKIATLLSRLGQPCVVRWAAMGTGKLAIPAAQLASSIRVRARTFTNASGVLQTAIVGTMPATDRNLQGATIQVGTRVYKVIGNSETVYEGGVLLQKVTLE